MLFHLNALLNGYAATAAPNLLQEYHQQIGCYTSGSLKANKTAIFFIFMIKVLMLKKKAPNWGGGSNNIKP
ncbi:hypothetical protein, partial [Kingella kingae]|uniref:hypothetical protein n=1 Tax=Kingella kingae TaxID=504 RepID=UPI001E650930